MAEEAESSRSEHDRRQGRAANCQLVDAHVLLLELSLEHFMGRRGDVQIRFRSHSLAKLALLTYFKEPAERTLTVYVLLLTASTALWPCYL